MIPVTWHTARHGGRALVQLRAGGPFRFGIITMRGLKRVGVEVNGRVIRRPYGQVFYATNGDAPR